MSDEIDKARFRKGLTHKSVIIDSSQARRSKNRSLSPFYATKSSMILPSNQDADDPNFDDDIDLRRSGTVVFESKALSQSVLYTDEGRASICFPDTPSKDEVKKDVRSLTQEDWAHDFFCFNCKRRFDKLRGTFRHHCRICGRSVCKECSTKKIADQRACDVCYHESEDQEAAAIRREFMAYVDRILKEKQEEILSWEDKIQEKEAEVLRFAQQTKTTLETLEKNCQTYATEYNKAKFVLVQQSETNDYLKKAVNNSEGRSNDLEKELASIETKIKQEKLDIANCNHAYLSKLEEQSQKHYVLERLEDIAEQRNMSDRKNPRTRSAISTTPDRNDSFADSVILADRDRASFLLGDRGRASTKTSYIHRQPSFILESKGPEDSFIGDEDKKKRGFGCGVGFFNCTG